MNGLLNVNNLHCGYGNIEVLHGLNFEIQQGQVVALIGANGAGKTTTLRVLSALLPVTQGEITLEGADITRKKPHELVALGMAHVPEGRQVFPELTVHENLQMGGYSIRSGKAVEKRILEMYARFPRLKERCAQVSGTLSGGEQQMLAIARALMSSPKILLMDEPSMGLSPKLVGEVFGIIRELKEQGITILLVEQNAHMALTIANYAYALQNGEIVLSGTGEEMLGNEQVRSAYLAE